MRAWTAFSLIVILLLTACVGTVASGNVTVNERIPITGSGLSPCAPQDGDFTFDGEAHLLIREQSDGSLAYHVNSHGQGTAVSGTKYVWNYIADSVVAAGSFATDTRTQLISQGSSDNAHITFHISFPPFEIGLETDCRG